MSVRRSDVHEPDEDGAPDVVLQADGFRYAMVPEELIYDRSVNDRDRTVWMAWCRAAGSQHRTHRNQRYIAEKLGVSLATVQRATTQLAEHGWLNLEPWFREDGSRGPNTVVVIFDRSRSHTADSHLTSDVDRTSLRMGDHPRTDVARRKPDDESNTTNARAAELSSPADQKQEGATIPTTGVAGRAAKETSRKRRESSNQPASKTRAKPKSPHRDCAERLLKAWWEDQDPRPQQNYMGALKILERALADGWKEPVVRDALSRMSAVTATSLQFAANQVKQTKQTRPYPDQFAMFNQPQQGAS